MTLLTKLLNEKADQRTTFAVNLLKVLKLGESREAPFAAVRELVDGELRRRWMSPDAAIICDFFELPHTTDNLRSHP